MTHEATSPLRRRMIEDMTIRKFAPKTQHDYVQRVKTLTLLSRDCDRQVGLTQPLGNASTVDFPCKIGQFVRLSSRSGTRVSRPQQPIGRQFFRSR